MLMGCGKKNEGALVKFGKITFKAKIAFTQLLKVTVVTPKIISITIP